MNKIKLLVTSLFLANVAFAHVADFHVLSPSEKHDIDRWEQERIDRRNEDIMMDPDVSESDRLQAISDLVDSGRMA